MYDERLPSREGGARLRARDGRHGTRRLLRLAVFALGFVATVSRTAVALTDPQQLTPLARRWSAGAALALELASDPAQALTAIALVTTISGVIAAWRRSAAAGAAVAATMLAAIVEAAAPT